MENLVEIGNCWNEGEELEEEPSGERWPPLGAAADSSCPDFTFRQSNEAERVKDLEEQQELLNSSLIALSTHFAQVQFRLRQIVDAPAQDKEFLLRELEEFAFRGIPEIPDKNCHAVLHQDGKEFEAVISAQRAKQKEVIGQLKSQLEELENYAYEMGEAGLPQSVIMEKQKVIIDELKCKLNLNVDDIDRLTLEDIRHQVDNAVSQLVNPLKMKEQLVIQLKTQIMDLERFIDFLQGDSDAWNAPESLNSLKERKWDTSRGGSDSSGGKHQKIEKRIGSQYESHRRFTAADKSEVEERRTFELECRQLSPTLLLPPPIFPGSVPNVPPEFPVMHEEVKDKTINMIRRAAALLQLFAVSQFGCGSSTIRMNSLKKSMKGYHWGDMRARLELAVVNVLALASEEDHHGPCDYSSDSESVATNCDARMTAAVRKQLAISIRDLMQHGLTSAGKNTSLVPFVGCFSARSRDVPTMHAWELILKYYELKNGARFNSTPVRKLSQSFNLNIVGSKAISNKENMLGAIGNIVSLHTQFKRSNDAHFKAFICAALNCRKLVIWLRLIFRCQPLVEMYYEPWSYVAKTGFEDSLQSLDKLTHIKFDLPVDIAVHQFQNIKDAF